MHEYILYRNKYDAKIHRIILAFPYGEIAYYARFMANLEINIHEFVANIQKFIRVFVA